MKVSTAISTAVLSVVVSIAALPASAQGFLELLRSGGNAYAPADAAPRPAEGPPLSIMPSDHRRPPAAAVAPRQKPAAVDENDEDAEALFEHDEPKRVTVALPPLRPGSPPRALAGLSVQSPARWSPAGETLPPGVNLPGSSQPPPQPPRLAALPSSQAVPRWSLTDETQVRPASLRDSEQPVAGMPGVYAPPEAIHSCLPVGLKQVLVDTAKRFGHVAVLNAQRSAGTGARGSYHYRCRAVDFRVRGHAVSSVMGFLRAHPNVGGRKIYPMGFFHIDDGPVRSW